MRMRFEAFELLRFFLYFTVFGFNLHFVCSLLCGTHLPLFILDFHTNLLNLYSPILSVTDFRSYSAGERQVARWFYLTKQIK